MRALVFDGVRARLERAQASPGDAAGASVDLLLRPRRVAISSLDLDAARPGSGFRGVLGHSCVGVVERALAAASASGAGDDLLAAARKMVGKTVVVSPVIPCGACDLCLRGLPAHCRNAEIVGLKGRDGCLAEAVRVPAGCCAPAPEGLDDDAAACAAGVAAALHAAQQARADQRSLVTVLGDGRMGLVIAQALARVCPKVRVLGRHEHRLALCERWGVAHRAEREAGRRADQDAVVECTGTAEGLALALAMVRPRGRVVLVSRLREAGAVDLRPAVDREAEIVGSRGGSIPEALALLGQGAIDVLSLITRRFRLDDAEQALRAAGEASQVQVVVEVDEKASRHEASGHRA